MFTTLLKRLLRLADRTALLARTVRLRRTFPGMKPVQRDGTWYLASTAPARPVADFLRQLLDLVVEACEAGGHEYAVLPNRDPQSTRVMVAREQAPEVLERLREAAADRPLYAHPTGRRSAVLLRDLPVDVDAATVRLFQLVALPDGGLIAGTEHGCDLVLAPEVDGYRELGPDNLVAERVPTAGLRPATLEVLGERYRTYEPFDRPGYLDAIEFPIDVVYTWVDGDDPQWRASRDAHLGHSPSLNEQAANASRYIDRDELRYSLRSLHLHAEWVRHIWLVTAGHVPEWLDTDHPGLTVVPHEEIFADPGVLPTFNSHAIESQLHRIPGLAEHYLYFNDDVHLGRRVTPETFFLSNGQPKFFPSRYQIELGPATVEDPPVIAAGKNGRDLLDERFGRVVTQKLRHTPHPQRRSTIDALEREFPEAFERTAAARFRTPADISVASALSHHYGYVRGLAVPGDLRYVYIDLTAPTLPAWLERLQRERMLEVFCINDTEGTPEQLAERGPLLSRFLRNYFPEPSPYER